VHVDHPLLRPGVLEERAYQANITRTSLERSTLVVLPTGMGKTVIAARVLAEVLHRRGGKALFLAPTKPLVEQHATFLRRCLVLPEDAVTVFTGEATPPAERELLWRTTKVICSTPQVVRNDVRRERIALDDVTVVVFDEAHRAVGDYAYVDVAARYGAVDGLVLGMTASPGSDAEKILEVCANLGIEAVEIRTEFDPDVVPYIHDVKVEAVRVDAPERIRTIRTILRGVHDEFLGELAKLGLLDTRRRPRKRDLLALGNDLQRRLRRGERHNAIYRGLSLQAAAVKVDHAVELVETQGLEAFREYVARLQEEGAGKGSSRATRILLKHPRFAEALALARDTEVEHPKVKKVVQIVLAALRRNPEARIIVFAHYRDTSEILVRTLRGLPGVRPIRFVGQATRGTDVGLKQKEQVEIVERFRQGECNVLVASPVGEEGLDIPATDLVVFYEPVPSEIRTIQRRGRTGRSRAGRVVVLVTRDTRDEAYYYSALRKERKMHEELARLREDLKQKIFVGTPTGETFAASAPKERLERLREASLEKGRRAGAKKKPEQARLPDF
jgi:Fanconi anemia group M protein